MDSDTWARLSEWHNLWLDAAPGERERLRRDFVAGHPALEADVNDLVMAGAIAPGFLETPAIAFVLDDLAAEDATLAAGTLVGPYRIAELLARGGMGQVYRATDIRLGRDVAVKLVSGGGQHEPGVVERFIQEARVTAGLDRPNIVRLFDVGVHEGRPFLVMELLDGETLRRRLARGPIPPDEARRVALDVARGLVAAHGVGLVHHDLKPENLFVTRPGVTKILDFGVARLAPDAKATGPALATMAGMLVGTAGYLAPEEILGEPADQRADLFALGAILYEMLTGRRAFARDHTIDTLHAVLHDPVPPLGAAAGVSADLWATVSRLLEKAPDARFQSAADLAWTLDRLDTPATVAHEANTERRGSRQWLVAAIAAAVAAAVVLPVGAAWWRTSPAPVATPMALSQFTWRLPDDMALASQPIVSPDGRQIAFAGASSTGHRLFVRDLAALEAAAVPGTEGAKQPFWSPDSQSLGFFARGKLLRVTVAGGAPVELADAPDARGGTWGSAGTIVFQPAYRDSGLMRVPADGGRAEAATRLDVEAGDVAHRWPYFLPDGIHFVYHLTALQDARRGVYAGSTAGPATTAGSILFTSESGATYVPQPGSPVGTLLTARVSGIEARPFDARALAVVGDAVRVAVPTAAATPHQAAMLDASGDAMVVAGSAVPFGRRLVSMSPTGAHMDLITGTELGGWPRLSPDGRQLLRSWVDPARGNPDVWVRDLARGTELRVTTGSGLDVSPVWSPRGDRIAYRSGTVTTPLLAIANADGTGSPRTLPCPRPLCEPTDWSADGRLLLVNTDGDIWTVPVDPNEAAQPLLASASNERDARYSPDGRWIAYVSDESGRTEVSIRSVTGPARRIVVSNQGGDQPVWQADGAALFYVDHEETLHRVTVQGAAGGLALGRPEPMRVPAFEPAHWGTTYEVSRDGTRLFLPLPTESKAPHDVTILLGWRALLHEPRQAPRPSP